MLTTSEIMAYSFAKSSRGGREAQSMLVEVRSNYDRSIMLTSQLKLELCYEPSLNYSHAVGIMRTYHVLEDLQHFPMHATSQEPPL
jgi:hypothetical protein